MLEEWESASTQTALWQRISGLIPPPLKEGMNLFRIL
jgi:hypothetical protein